MIWRTNKTTRKKERKRPTTINIGMLFFIPAINWYWTQNKIKSNMLKINMIETIFDNLPFLKKIRCFFLLWNIIYVWHTHCRLNEMMCLHYEVEVYGCMPCKKQHCNDIYWNFFFMKYQSRWPPNFYFRFDCFIDFMGGKNC